MAQGYLDRILRIDLSTRKIDIDKPGEAFFRTYFGGWGIVAHYLLKLVPPEADPFGPDNVLVFAPGVLSGSPIGGSSRHAVGAKSPLTGGFGEADAGGYWGAELKRAGWDGIVITGKSEKPVYLLIDDDQVEIRDGTHLWGKRTADVERVLRSEHGRVRAAQCGLAGENLVRYACVVHDAHRAAGRTGLGAVMGSKRLKSIAVRGTGRVEMADREGVQRLVRETFQEYSEQWSYFQEHGTSGALAHKSQEGTLPTRNFQEGSFEGADKITGEAITESILVKRETCFACPISCKRRVKADGRYQVDPEYGGPEYETAAALGACCGIDDLEAIAYGNQLCNAYGLDTISTGVAIAWAMECFERGILSQEDTGGLDLRFGNAEAMVSLIEWIARRDGFGDVLAEGSLRAAAHTEPESEQYAMQVKGQELALHDPRTKFGHAVGLATSPTGAEHMHNIHDGSYASERGINYATSMGILEPCPVDYLGPEKIRMAVYHIDFQVFHNCLGLCMFMPFSREQMCELVAGVTGWDTSLFEAMKAGERALAMARAFNYLHGLEVEDDNSPARFSVPFESGPLEGKAIPPDRLDRAIQLYYDMRGWDSETGAPTAAKLYELGLGWVAEMLYPRE